MPSVGETDVGNQYFVVDTTIFSHLTSTSEDSPFYLSVIGDRRIAISFQSKPELLSAGFAPKRQQRLDDLLAVTLELPHSEATNTWYARVTDRRRELRKSQQLGRDASDADVWIISGALEHGLPLLSHDRQQVSLGRAMGLRVVTNLSDLRETNPNL